MLEKIQDADYFSSAAIEKENGWPWTAILRLPLQCSCLGRLGEGEGTSSDVLLDRETQVSFGTT